MDSFQVPSSLSCELSILRAKNIESNSMGCCLFVRCYISAGKNKRIRLESKQISPESNLVWNQSFSLDCFGNKQSMSMLMQGTVVFELRRRNIVSVFGRIGMKSQLLGQAEIPWKSVFESSTMKIERWVVMTSKSTGKYRQEEVKPPAVEISMKVGVPAMPKQRKISIGKLRKQEDVQTLGAGLEVEKKQGSELQELNDTLEDVSDLEQKIKVLEKELRTAKEKIHGSEKEIASLKHQLECNTSSVQHLHDSAKIDTSTWKVKLDKEKREVSKLQDRILRYKANLSERDHEIRALRETISNANKSLSEENSQLQADMTKLLKERAYLEDNLKEWDLRCQSVEEELRRVQTGKAEAETMYRADIEQLKVCIAERDDRLEELNKSVDIFTLKYNTLMTETHELNVKVAGLTAEVSFKDEKIDQMSKHLHELHIEHVELIAGTERARKMTEGLRSRVKELEEEVERQQEVIMEGAEEKREAIRQLCFSLEHYRNGYHRLRQAFVGQRRFPVVAS